MIHDCGATIEAGMTMCSCGELLIWEGEMLEAARPPTASGASGPSPEPDVMCELCERRVPADADACSFCATPVGPRPSASAPDADVVLVALPGGVSVRVGVGPLTLGRLSDDDRVAAALDRDQISRRHASLRIREGAVWLSDLGSTNGTWLSGREVTNEVRLPPGDHVVGLGQRITVTVHVPRDLGTV